MALFLGLYVRLMAALLYLAIIIICPLLRFKIPRQAEFRQPGRKKKVLFAVWHQSTFVMFYLYRGSGAAIMVTEETRGQILSHCARWLGYRPIAIPWRQDSFAYVKGVTEMIKQIKAGHDAVVAVDGPGGPLFQAKPGAAYLAEKTGVMIVPVGIKAPFKFTLRWRWDKYYVPLPFSPVRVRLGKPIKPGKEATAELQLALTRLAK